MRRACEPGSVLQTRRPIRQERISADGVMQLWQSRERERRLLADLRGRRRRPVAVARGTKRDPFGMHCGAGFVAATTDGLNRSRPVGPLGVIRHLCVRVRACVRTCARVSARAHVRACVGPGTAASAYAAGARIDDFGRRRKQIDFRLGPIGPHVQHPRAVAEHARLAGRPATRRKVAGVRSGGGHCVGQGRAYTEPVPCFHRANAGRSMRPGEGVAGLTRSQRR